jgi:hypothetical protein
MTGKYLSEFPDEKPRQHLLAFKVILQRHQNLMRLEFDAPLFFGFIAVFLDALLHDTNNQHRHQNPENSSPNESPLLILDPPDHTGARRPHWCQAPFLCF